MGGGGAAVGGGHGGDAGIMTAAQQLLGQAVSDWEADDDELRALFDQTVLSRHA